MTYEERKQAEAIEHLIGAAETLIESVTVDNATANDLRRYIVVVLAAAVKEVKLREVAA